MWCKQVLLLITLFLLTPCVWAQQVPPVTGAEGVVVDVRTGEPIAFAQVVFVGTQIGTMVDAEGHFQVENKQGVGDTLCRLCWLQKTDCHITRQPNDARNAYRVGARRV